MKTILRAGKQIAKRVAKSMGWVVGPRRGFGGMRLTGTTTCACCAKYRAAGIISASSAAAEEKRSSLPSSASAVRASRARWVVSSSLLLSDQVNAQLTPSSR